ncbi:MAG: permease prefix domain 1-containing protein [Oscillospiraceae bacterium]|nr:permease prefix domain 1-containing protein [Oscillospiraceae bacterium]
MDAIKTYLDNVFTAFPQTEQVLALKREMLGSMEEKYHALKAEGKSEHEAVGSVIANFGSIDEIVAELGLGTTQTEAPPREESLYLSHEAAHAYLGQTRKSSIWIGLGIWLILAGVSGMILFEGALGLFPMFTAIAIAVVLFVVNGVKLWRYETYESTAIRLDAGTRAELEEMSRRFTTRFTVQIAVGVGLIIFTLGALVFLFQTGHVGVRVFPVILLCTVGFSAFLFTTGGMPKSAFDILLNRGDYRNKLHNRKMAQIIGTIAGVYWPIVVAVYLLWSFLGDSWDISWVVWPVSGVIFGAVTGGIGAWFGMKER